MQLEDGEILHTFCSRCGRHGHTHNTCQETRNVRGIAIHKTMCTTCGLYGHHRSACRTIKVKKPWCERCAAFGHTKSVCRAERTVYGDSLVGIRRCALCSLFGHTVHECREEMTAMGDVIQRAHVRIGLAKKEAGQRGRSQSREKFKRRATSTPRGKQSSNRERSAAGNSQRRSSKTARSRLQPSSSPSPMSASEKGNKSPVYPCELSSDED